MFLLGFVLLLTLVLLLLPTGQKTRLGELLFDVAHVVLGALLALAIDRVLRAHGWRGLPAAAGAFGGALLFLGLVEWIQPFFGRGASWDDLAGACLGAVIVLLFDRAWRSRGLPRGALALAGLGLAAAALAGPARTAWDIRRQLQAIPLLASFEDDLELGRWRASGAAMRRQREHATRGSSSLAFTVRLSEAPIVALHRPPCDWRGYDTLALDLWLGGERPINVEIQLDDHHNECASGFRALTRVRLQPGPNAVRVSLEALAVAPPNGPLDLGRVARLGLMPVGRNDVRTLWLDHVRLERAPWRLAPRSR